MTIRQESSFHPRLCVPPRVPPSVRSTRRPPHERADPALPFSPSRRQPRMNTPFASELIATANAIVSPGRGILAADESTGTIGKRFEAIGERVRGARAAPPVSRLRTHFFTARPASLPFPFPSLRRRRGEHRGEPPRVPRAARVDARPRPVRVRLPRLRGDAHAQGGGRHVARRHRQEGGHDRRHQGGQGHGPDPGHGRRDGHAGPHGSVRCRRQRARAPHARRTHAPEQAAASDAPHPRVLRPSTNLPRPAARAAPSTTSRAPASHSGARLLRSAAAAARQTWRSRATLSGAYLQRYLPLKKLESVGLGCT